MILANSAVKQDLLWCLNQAKRRRPRSMRQFAEDEIVLPSGPFAGKRFRCSRQPYTGLWFDAVDSGKWTRFVATGPTQSGKTVACFVIPMLYHLFEIGETVVCGLPDMDMALDKWREDILPIIERSKYRNLLPSQGAGSRGGLVQSLQFRNGSTLKFMSGGGGDKSRAGFTSRVVMITETDGMDEPGRNSRESDKVTQIIARTRAYGSRARIYMECTVSTENGRTWREYNEGTQSKIVLPCPHCREWVSPEREHLVGWHEAENQIQAKETSKFTCPSCGEAWNDEERIKANIQCRLLHRGQSIDTDGTVTGDLPPTDTLGFRWSAVNNMFNSPGELGAEEWQAARNPDEDNAERAMRQFVWCLPVLPTKFDDVAIETHELTTRISPFARGIVPEGTQYLTAAIDLGKYLNHWIVVAWLPGPYGYVVDYGRIEVASNDLGVEQASMVALRQFKDMVLKGWPIGSPTGTPMISNFALVDSGWMTDVVYAFCRESGRRFVAAVGRGADQQRQQWYNRPTQTGSTVKHIGEGFHINWLPSQNQHLFENNADHWKSWVHARLTCPVTSPVRLRSSKPIPRTIWRSPNI